LEPTHSSGLSEGHGANVERYRHASHSYGPQCGCNDNGRKKGTDLFFLDWPPLSSVFNTPASYPLYFFNKFRVAGELPALYGFAYKPQLGILNSTGNKVDIPTSPFF
jgi:hypothetical protein